MVSDQQVRRLMTFINKEKSLAIAAAKAGMMKRFSEQLPEEQVSNLEKDYLLGLGKTEDVANACAFLLSDATRWITGTNLIVDGGFGAR